MRRSLSTVSILCLALFCLGCVGADGEAGSEPGFAASLLAHAEDFWAAGKQKFSGEDAEGGSALSASKADPIVRCEINGAIEFTNESRCQNRGGHGVRMALKAKNDI